MLAAVHVACGEGTLREIAFFFCRRRRGGGGQCSLLDDSKCVFGRLVDGERSSHWTDTVFAQRNACTLLYFRSHGRKDCTKTVIANGPSPRPTEGSRRMRSSHLSLHKQTCVCLFVCALRCVSWLIWWWWWNCGNGRLI